MKILDVVQGSPEWEQARAGIPTASAFDKIITPKTLKLSGQSVTYRNQLLAERLLGHPIEWTGQNEWMERGTLLEPEARAFYEMQFDAEATPVGFVLRDDERVGGSPDSLVGEDGGLEIKCPAIHTHVGYMLEPEKLADYCRCQVQGNLYLTGRKWWDVLSYHPELPHVKVRILRDEKFTAALHTCLGEFLADLDAAWKQLEPHRILELPEAA